MKGSGGCIGLTENPVAFRRWMLTGPELVRLKQQLRMDNGDSEHFQNFQHHEEGFAAQKKFHVQVSNLYKTIQRMGNPFLDDFRFSRADHS